MKYEIFFELYGKKMKSTVVAKSEIEAKEAIKNKIIFHKIEEQQWDKHFKDICDNLGIKKPF